jgi:hypothetical protein
MKAASAIAIIALSTVGLGDQVPKEPAPTPLTDQDCHRLVVLVTAGETINTRTSRSSPSRKLSPLESAVGVLRQYRGELMGPDAAKFPGYTLRITRSSDGAHFLVSLTPVAAGCGTAWFGSEEDIVYSGRRVDCSRQGSSKHPQPKS